MSRIADTFRNRNDPVFIPYIMAGDPDPDTCVAAARALIDGGAGILELGMPFSDPVADGPTIQRAGERARAAGTTPDVLFTIIRSIRETSGIPIVIMTYYNIVYQRGVGRFCEEAKAAGADGILIVDLPPEESEEALAAAKMNSLDQIFLVAPTTSEPRMRTIAAMGSGYLYLVSVLGVTGARKEISDDALALIQAVRGKTSLPLAVGFGISNPEQARALAGAGADGIIVGSALVDIIEKNRNNPGAMASALTAFAKGITGAIRKK